MKAIIYFVVLLWVSISYATNPVVSNVRALQRQGTKIIDKSLIPKDEETELNLNICKTDGIKKVS